MNASPTRTFRQTVSCAILSAFCLSNAVAQTPRYRVRDVSYEAQFDWAVTQLNNAGEMIINSYLPDVSRLVYRRGETVINYGAYEKVTRINQNGEIILTLRSDNMITGILGEQAIFNLRTGVSTPFLTTEPVEFFDWRDNYGVGSIGTYWENRNRQFMFFGGEFHPIPGTEWGSQLAGNGQMFQLCNAYGKAIVSWAYGSDISLWNGSALEAYPLQFDTAVQIHDFNDHDQYLGYVIRSNGNSGYFQGQGQNWTDAPAHHSYLRINNRGDIVGVRTEPEDAISSFVSRNGQRHYLVDVLPAPYRGMSVNCINDFGQLGGTLGQPDNRSRAVVAAPQARINGTVQSNALSLYGQAVSVMMQSNLPQVTENIIVGANGAVTLDIDKDVPVTLRFHAPRHLIRAVSLTATAEDTLFGTVALIAGDANDDNAIDIADLLILIAHYNQIQGVGNYLEACDFNGDAANDITDLLFLIVSYNQQGD